MPDTSKPTTFYGLPDEVKFCKKCVMSNQRPSSSVEFKNAANGAKAVIDFDEGGVCSACGYHDMKFEQIDWDERGRQLAELCDQHRSKDGSYDVIVPGSGGKDSMYVAHILRHKFGMHPLTVTWPPNMYTDIGRRNFEAFLSMGANITISPDREVHRRLTHEAFLNLVHPFQPFIIGQKQVGPKAAIMHGVKLIIYGESQAEGGSNLAEAMNPIMSPNYYSVPRAEQSNIRLGGLNFDQLMEKGFTDTDLLPYLPAAREDVVAAGIEVHHMGFYERWIDQDKYYYAVEHCGFQPNQERTEGTYTKYCSLDDKIDGFHFYTTYVKFGIGRATYDAAKETRHRIINREEAVALVKRYDGEFPAKYFEDFLDYCDVDENTFWEKIDAARPPLLWTKDGNEWILRHHVE